MRGTPGGVSNRRKLALFAASGAALAAVGAAIVIARPSTAGGPARLDVVEAAVEVRSSTGVDFGSARSDTDLAAGSVVRTDPTGLAELEYDDGSFSRIGPNSTYEVTTLQVEGGRRQIVGSLDVGQTFHRVAKVSGSGSRFEVHTARAVAAVRGTAFAVQCRVSLRCDVGVTEGSVNVRGSDGSQVDLRAGQAVSVSPSGSVGPVTPLSLSDPWIARNIEPGEAALLTGATTTAARSPDRPASTGTTATTTTATTPPSSPPSRPEPSGRTRTAAPERPTPSTTPTAAPPRPSGGSGGGTSPTSTPSATSSPPASPAPSPPDIPPTSGPPAAEPSTPTATTVRPTTTTTAPSPTTTTPAAARTTTTLPSGTTTTRPVRTTTTTAGLVTTTTTTRPSATTTTIPAANGGPDPRPSTPVTTTTIPPTTTTTTDPPTTTTTTDPPTTTTTDPPTTTTTVPPTTTTTTTTTTVPPTPTVPPTTTTVPPTTITTTTAPQTTTTTTRQELCPPSSPNAGKPPPCGESGGRTDRGAANPEDTAEGR